MEQTGDQVEIAEQLELSGSDMPVECSAPHFAAGPAQPAPASFVYAIGRVELRFPSLAVEKEFTQATGRGNTAGQTDRQVLRSVLDDRANRYLARQVCWVFTIEGLDTYILVPRDPADVDLLIDAVRPDPGADDVDVVIGVRGPIAQSNVCNGLLVPIVVFDQLYSFARDEFIGEIPRLEGQAQEKFRATAGELFDRIGQVTDNAGATDDHRALNYLAVRYPAIYARAAEAHTTESTLTAIEVRPSPLSGTRSVMDVIFSYTHRRTDVTEKHFCRVDVTEKWPYLITKLSPYFDR
ncbi:MULTISPECIES: cyanobactin maturation protease PatG family protein [Streptomyces]|uniref:cyanobactin maturation protease PatG family protein n=1 Tax=Streptomyces TaxID=1883 RepID=UPI002F90E079